VKYHHITPNLIQVLGFSQPVTVATAADKQQTEQTSFLGLRGSICLFSQAVNRNLKKIVNMVDMANGACY